MVAVSHFKHLRNAVAQANILQLLSFTLSKDFLIKVTNRIGFLWRRPDLYEINRDERAS